MIMMFYTGVLSSIIESTSKPAIVSVRFSSAIDVSRLKSRYLRQLPTDKTSWAHYEVIEYVRLALMKMEDVPLTNENLNLPYKVMLTGS